MEHLVSGISHWVRIGVNNSKWYSWPEERILIHSNIFFRYFLGSLDGRLHVTSRYSSSQFYERFLNPGQILSPARQGHTPIAAHHVRRQSWFDCIFTSNGIFIIETWTHLNLIRKRKLCPNGQARESASEGTMKLRGRVDSDWKVPCHDWLWFLQWGGRFELGTGDRNGRAKRKRRLFGSRNNVSAWIRILQKFILGWILFQMRRREMGTHPWVGA